MRRMYDAVFFDFDGVLVDSEPIHFECWREILLPYGIDFNWETYAARCIGVSDRAMIEQLTGLADPPVSFDKLWSEYPRKKELFRQRMAGCSPVETPIRLLLDRLAGDYRLAVVTSSGQSEIEPILETSGIRGYFETVVYGGDVKKLKPAPDPYLTAVERLGTSNAIVVEDSASGIASARAAGLDVIEIPSQSDVPRLVRERLGIE